MSNSKLAILIVFISVLALALFAAYYFLIARPKIKADCLNAATRVVDAGESGFSRSNDLGERVEFSENKYEECTKIL